MSTEIAVRRNLAHELAQRVMEEKPKINQRQAMVLKAGSNAQIYTMKDKEGKRVLDNLADFIMRDLGMTPSKANEYERVRFVSSLYKYYPELTPSDVKQAFEFALIGELDEYLPKDKHGDANTDHYGAFSFKYWSRILAAYRKLKEQTAVSVRALLPEGPQYSEEDKRKIKLDFLRCCYFICKRLIKGQEVAAWELNSEVFKTLEGLGLVEFSDITTDDVNTAAGELLKAGRGGHPQTILNAMNSGAVPNAVKFKAEYTSKQKQVRQQISRLSLVDMEKVFIDESEKYKP